MAQQDAPQQLEQPDQQQINEQLQQLAQQLAQVQAQIAQFGAQQQAQNARIEELGKQRACFSATCCTQPTAAARAVHPTHDGRKCPPLAWSAAGTADDAS
eukprot:XP_001696847.1 predicted protein [Chlamydomonas reinhardtii]